MKTEVPIPDGIRCRGCRRTFEFRAAVKEFDAARLHDDKAAALLGARWLIRCPYCQDAMLADEVRFVREVPA